MALVRQMSELFLRGSLANITMANLTEKEQDHVEVIVDYVSNHSGMIKHRNRFHTELGKTIGADYKSDKLCGDSEFQIVVWKAAVELFYHREYNFRCKACGEDTWITQQGTKRPFDRQKLGCFSCKKVKVTDPGDTNLEKDTYIDLTEFQDSYKHFRPIQNAPKCESPIEYISGKKKYDDPNKIINCNKQLVKFFGEFVWNYFRQQLAENVRREHKKEPQRVVNKADVIIAEEILSLCQKMKITHNFCRQDQPRHGRYTINVVGFLTPPEFTIELAVLLNKAESHDIVVKCNLSNIEILENSDAEFIEAMISKPEHVLVMDNSTKNGDEDGSFTINQISFRTVGARKMPQENHVAKIDANDVMIAIRESLPDGDCKKIFDIQCGLGGEYADFSQEFGDAPARKNHIARHLAVTSRAVTNHIECIRNTCLAHGLVPHNKQPNHD